MPRPIRGRRSVSALQRPVRRRADGGLYHHGASRPFADRTGISRRTRPRRHGPLEICGPPLPPAGRPGPGNVLNGDEPHGSLASGRARRRRRVAGARAPGGRHRCRRPRLLRLRSLDCFRSDLRPSRARRACRAAFLVDAWIAAERADRDTLFLPIDGRRFRRPGYAWTVDGCAEVHTFPVLAIMRGRQMRRLGEQGAARRRAEERFDARFAETYAARLDAATTRLIVAQSLAPHLWRAGAFGGRRVDVLMTRPPIRILQERLDRLAARYPDSPTAADFRTDPSLIDAEDAALASARTWITPNADVAALAGSKAVRIPWRRPPASPVPRGRTIVFPGPTVARKGCWTVREAVRTLGARLAVVGSVVEGPDFWAGLDAELRPPGPGWLADAALVAAPTIGETRPTRLLEAIAAGVPVLTTPESGLTGDDGAVLLPWDDPEAWIQTIRRYCDAANWDSDTPATVGSATCAAYSS